MSANQIRKPFPDFTGQHINDAVVPLIVSSMGTEWNAPQVAQEDWTRLRRSYVDSYERDWAAVWGMYRLHRTVFEAAGLVHTGLHNFCGGGMLASFQVRAVTIGGYGYQSLSGVNPSKWTIDDPATAARIPEITPAVDPQFVELLSHWAVMDILKRSLCMWAFSWLLANNKVSAFLHDAAEGNLRDILLMHKSVPFLSPSIPETGANYMSAIALRDIPPEEHMQMEFGSYGNRMEARCRTMRPVMTASTEFTNLNSGNSCVAQHFLLTEGGYGIIPFTAYDEVREPKLPEWYTSKAETAGYLRMFPRSMFFN